MVHNGIEVAPAFKLSLPVGNGGERSYHKEWSTDPIRFLGREKKEKIINPTRVSYRGGREALGFSPLITIKAELVIIFFVVGPSMAIH